MIDLSSEFQTDNNVFGDTFGNSGGSSGGDTFDVDLGSYLPDNNSGSDSWNGWGTLARIGTGLVVSGLTANRLSNPSDTGRMDQVFSAMLTEQLRNSERAEDMWQNYLTTFRPIEQGLAAAAAGYDTPERRERAASEAVGQVGQSYDQQRQEAHERMLAAGLDPSTIEALGASSRLVQARDEAGAANKARTEIETTGLGLMERVAQLGRGLVPGGSQGASAASSTNASVANNAATSGANAQNQNTQMRNDIFGDIVGSGLQAYGMGLFDAKPAGG